MSKLTEIRAGKDAFFRTANSPLAPEQRRQFAGLKYFDENRSLRIEALLHKYPKPERVQMLTSTGHSAEYLKYGWVQFEVGGQAQTLQVYKSEDGDELLLPFMDATTGRETYGSGRYLDLYEYGDGTVILDFNRSYNPWCAYSDQWSCPIPPVENRLAVRIEAGEKKYFEDGH